MHNASQSPPLTIGRTVPKESVDLVILRVTFDSKMTFEKHLRLVSRAASQRLGILRKSCRLFYNRSVLRRCFRGFVLPVLEYSVAEPSVWCSECGAECTTLRTLGSRVWCSATDTYLKPLDRAVSCARFLTWGVFECDIAHRRSVIVLSV